MHIWISRFVPLLPVRESYRAGRSLSTTPLFVEGANSRPKTCIYRILSARGTCVKPESGPDLVEVLRVSGCCRLPAASVGRARPAPGSAGSSSGVRLTVKGRRGFPVGMGLRKRPACSTSGDAYLDFQIRSTPPGEGELSCGAIPLNNPPIRGGCK